MGYMDNFLSDGPLVSIIVAIYNTDKYLSKCITSIINQTYRNIEIILVNDGSNDKSNEIIDNFLCKDNRIFKVDHGQNRGLLQARLSGIEHCNGKYVCFIDSDDSISIDWIRTLVLW